MTKRIPILFAALLLTAAAAVPVAYTELPVEAVKTGHAAAFSNAAAAIPIVLTGAKQNLRCDARLRWRSGGYHNRCPYGRIVTGVQLSNDLAILECAEVEVQCR